MGSPLVLGKLVDHLYFRHRCSRCSAAAGTSASGRSGNENNAGNPMVKVTISFPDVLVALSA